MKVRLLNLDAIESLLLPPAIPCGAPPVVGIEILGPMDAYVAKVAEWEDHLPEADEGTALPFLVAECRRARAWEDAARAFLLACANVGSNGLSGEIRAFLSADAAGSA